MSSSSAARPVAISMMSGHGTVPDFIVPLTSRKVMTPVAMTRIHGSVPVQKKSKTLPPRTADRIPPGASTVTHSKNPKMKKPIAPPTFIQSDVLNLLRSTCASR